LQSVIAVARNRGIDVVCNEVSNRATPSLVSFGPKQRYLGEAAKTQEISNFKNTICSLKRLAGRNFHDTEIQEIERRYINAELVDHKGQIAIEVNYLGEKRVFTGTQLIAMYFTKLRETASAELKIPVTDVVISVPVWFTDVQRRSILDSAEIAGFNCLRLLNDTTASALGYGITKTDLPEDIPRNVVIVDIGHSSYTVAVVSFLKGKLSVKATAFDRQFGGRDFDEVLVNHFSEVFKESYKIDVKSNPKALLRLRTGCEKIKKVLSANTQSPLNIENIMNDVDASSMINREEFEELAKELLDRVEAPLARALEDANLTKEEIHSIEVVGGTTRIPAIKERISKFFGKELNFTLNQDEAIARGCALQCAMLSPVFKVRDFAIQDTTYYPIKVQWKPIPEVPDEESELVVFNKFNSLPSTKNLTFHRKEPFDIEAYYADPSQLPPGVNPWIGQVHIKNVTPSEKGDLSMIKVRTKLNIHGILLVDSAKVVEEIIEEVKNEKEEVKKEKEEVSTNDESQPMDTDQTNTEESPKPQSPKVKKVKKLVNKADLPIIAGHGGLDKSFVNTLKEQEAEMIATDKLVADTEMQKNMLEEYVYDTRSKVETTYVEYINQEDREKFLALLSQAEDWLYDEGEDSTKSVYTSKLSDLKKIGNPIANRYREADERPKAEKQLRDSIQSFMLSATSDEERFSHITESEKKSVIEKATQILEWLNDKIGVQAQLPKYADPIVLADQILKERDALVQYCSPIILRPKPKPEPEPKPEPKPESTPAPETPATDTAATSQGESETSQSETPVTNENIPDTEKKEPSNQNEMDVD
jgi:heat shock protein 4